MGPEGLVPSEIGLLRALSNLDLSDHALSRSLPTEFGLLKSLNAIYLGGNNLTELPPTEPGMLGVVSSQLF